MKYTWRGYGVLSFRGTTFKPGSMLELDEVDLKRMAESTRRDFVRCVDESADVQSEHGSPGDRPEDCKPCASEPVTSGREYRSKIIRLATDAAIPQPTRIKTSDLERMLRERGYAI